MARALTEMGNLSLGLRKREFGFEKFFNWNVCENYDVLLFAAKLLKPVMHDILNAKAR